MRLPGRIGNAVPAVCERQQGLNTITAARACLVIGAARSGKSRYAQQLAEAAGRQPIYLATATVGDDEMRARVDAHRSDRDPRWRTVEEPLALAEVLGDLTRPDAIVLVDCLTLWLSNLMLGGADIEAATGRLAASIPRLPGPVVFVSNEVGAGIVPDNRLARSFRDAQGRLNQVMASVCDTVVLVSAGLPMLLKPGADSRVRFA
jgi:adenosylcobinamide kinase / adenosylcobinamide-phosphate guanylyltransferase